MFTFKVLLSFLEEGLVEIANQLLSLDSVAFETTQFKAIFFHFITLLMPPFYSDNIFKIDFI